MARKEFSTTTSCLVSLNDWPPFIVTISDIELVHFNVSTKTPDFFDMTFVFKDYNVAPKNAQEVSMSHLEKIKDWLNNHNIWYKNAKCEFVWSEIMERIRKNLSKFFETGGWNAIYQDPTKANFLNLNQKQQEEIGKSAMEAAYCRYLSQNEKREGIEENDKYMKQEELILTENRLVPKLDHMMIHPKIHADRMSGTLEAHTNGFRYSSPHTSNIDILYSNVKHLIFEICHNSNVNIFHFHLKNTIKWEERMIKDIQFYTRVKEIMTDLGIHQQIEVDEGIRNELEHEIDQRLLSELIDFETKVLQEANGQIEWESPDLEPLFRKTDYSSNFLVPRNDSITELKGATLSFVSLFDWPPFIVTISEIEVVYLKVNKEETPDYFDITFIFKDYTVEPRQIRQIPIISLEGIKNSFCNDLNIWYKEGDTEYNWQKILERIRNNPLQFFELGGWNSLELVSTHQNYFLWSEE